MGHNNEAKEAVCWDFSDRQVVQRLDVFTNELLLFNLHLKGTGRLKISMLKLKFSQENRNSPNCRCGLAVFGKSLL